MINNPSKDDKQSQKNWSHLLRPPLTELSPSVTTTTFKPIPRSIVKSIEDRRRRLLHHARSTSDVLHSRQSSIDDDLYDNYETVTTTDSSPKHTVIVTRTERSPSESRLTLYPNNSHQSQIVPSSRIYENDFGSSVPSLIEVKSPKSNRANYIRRNVLERGIARRIHSTFSSSTPLRTQNQRRSSQNPTQHSNRNQTQYLSRESKWHFVRIHLTDIAMMSQSYARMRVVERDLRWMELRELIRKQVLEMREMSILRQQYEGTLTKSQKVNSELQAIPLNEVVHVERDGRVYSINTRDLVLGNLVNDEAQLDRFAQMDARRKFQTKQSLLKHQEGRARMKRNIAFSFCFFNLSFIALMFAAMLIFAMKTVIELKSRQLF